MKYYIIAGEASGDLHGSNLMRNLKKVDQHASFRFFGGDAMKSQGGTLIKHYRDMAFMGFSAVVSNLRSIIANLALCKQDILVFKPDVIILIDYAGFNLKIAKFAHNQAFKVVYYISPKFWAWRESRVEKIKKFIDDMFVILPFEEDFYAKHSYQAEYVGNPILDAVHNYNSTFTKEKFFETFSIKTDTYTAILAGSRKQEIDIILPDILEVTKHFRKQQFVLAAAPSLPEEYYHQFDLGDNVKVVYNKTYDVLSYASSAIVTSGTATLETALFNVPQVVCYKTNTLTYRIGVLFVDVKKFRFISLVNLITGKEVVKEIIQFNLVHHICEELKKILYNNSHRHNILQGYKEMNEILGQYKPSKKVAERIWEKYGY